MFPWDAGNYSTAQEAQPAWTAIQFTQNWSSKVISPFWTEHVLANALKKQVEGFDTTELLQTEPTTRRLNAKLPTVAEIIEN